MILGFNFSQEEKPQNQERGNQCDWCLELDLDGGKKWRGVQLYQSLKSIFNQHMEKKIESVCF